MIERLGRGMGVALLLAFALPAHAADAVLYRIFLLDGGSIVSYGDFARVADRVIVSVPIGTAQPPELQLVSIRESAVDWQLTDRYADAARAKHYAMTRGEDDFNLLSNDVARALNEVALTDDPAKRVALADQARQQLAEWPASHFGYRAADVAQLSTLLDDVVSELRVAAGQSRFDLKLVAPTVSPPAMEVLPSPSLRESIELAFTAARVASEPAERVSLLESITRALGPMSAEGETNTNGSPASDAKWIADARARVLTVLATERQVNQAYAELAARTLARADDRARRADVRGLDALIRSVMTDDAKLGRARPAEVAALLVAVDAKKTAAQRLRLARDAWALRAGALRAYRRQLARPLDRLNRAKQWLEDVRLLAGPTPKAVGELEKRAAIASRELALVKPPPELESVHSLLTAACSLASRAATSRLQAIASGEMPAAWEAASAASGALMMLERADEDLNRLTDRPRLQ